LNKFKYFFHPKFRKKITRNSASEYLLVKDPMKIKEEEIEEEVKNEVIYLHQQGMSCRNIAAQTDLSKSKVDRIIQSHKIDDNVLL
jgi:hypothetical protein